VGALNLSTFFSLNGYSELTRVSRQNRAFWDTSVCENFTPEEYGVLFLPNGLLLLFNGIKYAPAVNGQRRCCVNI
jgi:hypothetical protein